MNVGFRRGIEDFNIFKVSFATNNSNELRSLYTAESGQKDTDLNHC